MKSLFFALFCTLFFTIVANGTYITQYHTVKKGETLLSLAAKYKTSVEELKNWNNMKSTRIFTGQRLIVNKYQKKDENTSYYTVKKGDTLFEISRKTGVSVEKLKDYNNLSTNTLYPGQRIRTVPGKQKTVATKKAQTAIATAPADTYVVKRGDTLSGISRKTGVPINELKKINNLKNSKLAIGQKLVLRVNETPVIVETQQVIASAGSIDEKKNQDHQIVQPARTIYINRYHTIKKGDSLSKIARKYGATVTTIKRLNNLKSNTIHPGKTIIVARIVKEVSPPVINPTPIAPVTPKIYYRVKLGDTLESIAARFGISVAALKESNLLFDGRIKIGQTLVIPEVANNVEDAGFETSISTEEKYDTQKFLALKVIEHAINFINTPYRYGGLSQKGIDCSGLVKKSYEAVGISIPRTSREQAKEGEIIPLSAIKPGDLLFFGNKGHINHVGIYIGDNKFVHASREFGKVVVADLNDRYYQNHLICARTLINGDVLESTDRKN